MSRLASTQNQALPVLLPSRSPSPSLREGHQRGRCPDAKVLPFASGVNFVGQALPALQVDAADGIESSEDELRKTNREKVQDELRKTEFQRSRGGNKGGLLVRNAL